MQETLKEIFSAALRAVDPYDAVKRYTGRVRAMYEEGGSDKLLVLAFGKAAARMALAVEEELGELITGGLAVTKYGHSQGVTLKKIALREAAHPVPDEAGLKAAREAAALAAAADERTLTLCLISGGGSALLSLPARGISLSDKMAVTGMLLKSGADIGELNAVRKHISRVKGGRLAAMLRPARVVSLIVSDVMGDSLDVIASGPTHPDSSTFSDALRVLDKYSLTGRAPMSVVEFIRRGAEGEALNEGRLEALNEGRLKVPSEGSGGALFKDVKNIIICSNGAALGAARKRAEELGYEARVLTAALSGEASDAGRWLARKALGAGPGSCLIAGGETTVAVRGHGMGGRNMELALAFALEAEGAGGAEGTSGVHLLAAGTDGTDGDTDAAGAFSDGGTAGRARAMGVDPGEYLSENDSYNFFRRAGGLFITGPTGTNVMDMAVVIVKED